MDAVSLVHLGSFHDTVTANENLIDTFITNAKQTNPSIHFNAVRKIAIEAPAGTQFSINGVDLWMPTTEIFELGLDYVQITSLIFKSSVSVNIVYMY